MAWKLKEATFLKREGAVWRWEWCWGHGRECKCDHFIQQQGSRGRLEKSAEAKWIPGGEEKLDWESWRVRGKGGIKDVYSLSHWFSHGFIQFSFKQILHELRPGEKRKNWVPALEWLITIYKWRQNSKHLLLSPSPQTFLKQVLLSGVMTICWSHRASQYFHVKTYIKKW